MSIKMLLEIVEMRQKPVIVSDTRKVDVSILFNLESPFFDPMFERLTQKTEPKILSFL